MRIWTNKIMILSSLLVCMLKLEKQIRQLGNSSFLNCSTNIIWNANFTSRYLQEIKNLKLARLLFGEIYSAKLLKAFSHAQIWLDAILRLFGEFLVSNLLHLLKSKKSEYFVLFIYIIAILMVT